MTQLLDSLNQQLQYVAASSVFYRDRLAEVGLAGGARSMVQFLEAPPLMNKEIERESLDASAERFGHPFGLHLCADPRNLYSVMTTSGTTGPPTWYLFTRDDWRRGLAADRRALRFAGVRRGDTAIYVFAAGSYIATLHVDAMRQMGVTTFEAGAHLAPERLAEMCERLHPSVILGTPTTMFAILDTGWRPAPEHPIRTIICGGEPAAAIPRVRERLESGFSGTVRDIFGPVSGNMFMSCDAPSYSGLHFLSPESGLGPIDLHSPLNRAHIPMGPGAEGELYYTALRHEAAPLIKYASGDMVRVDPSPCACGSSAPRVNFRGRVADMVAVGAARVGPWHVREAAAELSALSSNIRLVQPRLKSPALHVLAEASGDLRAAKADARRLETTLAARFRISVEVIPVPPGTLPGGAPKTALTLSEEDADALLAYLARKET